MARWLTVTQYAEVLGIHRRTAQSWARTGRVRARRTEGGHWLISAREIDHRLYTVPNAAFLLGMSERTLRSWIDGGRAKARRARDGGTWLIEGKEIDRLKAEPKVPVENEGGRRA